MQFAVEDQSSHYADYGINVTPGEARRGEAQGVTRTFTAGIQNRFADCILKSAAKRSRLIGNAMRVGLWSPRQLFFFDGSFIFLLLFSFRPRRRNFRFARAANTSPG